MGVKGLVAAAITAAVLIGVALPGPASRAVNAHARSQHQTLALN